MRNVIKHGLVFASLLTLAASAVACGGDDKPAQDPSSLQPPPPPAPPPPAPAPAATDTKPVDSAMGGGTNAGSDTTATAKPAEKPMTDAEIVAVTSTANNGEIDMANLATKSATSADVKNFAAMMITQHKDMESKGKALAAKAKITPADSDASNALKSDVQSTISNLKTQKGKDFDKAYMDSQVKMHTEGLDIIDNQLLPSVKNADMKDHLNTVRQHVQMHLSKAQDIQSRMEAVGTTSVTSGTMKGKGDTSTTTSGQTPGSSSTKSDTGKKKGSSDTTGAGGGSTGSGGTSGTTHHDTNSNGGSSDKGSGDMK